MPLNYAVRRIERRKNVKMAGRRRGPEKMPMAELQLLAVPVVPSSSLRLALDIFQARLTRGPVRATEVLIHLPVCWWRGTLTERYRHVC